MAVFLTIPGPFSTDILPIMAVAMQYSSKNTTEMEGGTGEQTGDLSPSAGGLIPGGITS